METETQTPEVKKQAIDSIMEVANTVVPSTEAIKTYNMSSPGTELGAEMRNESNHLTDEQRDQALTYAHKILGEVTPSVPQALQNIPDNIALTIDVSHLVHHKKHVAEDISPVVVDTLQTPGEGTQLVAENSTVLEPIPVPQIDSTITHGDVTAKVSEVTVVGGIETTQTIIKAEIIDEIVPAPDVVVQELKPVVEAPDPIAADKLAKQLNESMSKVFSKGTLLSLHIKMWSMLAPLKKEELGIENVEPIFKLGHKLLVKEEVKQQFTQLQGQARNIVNKFGHIFPISEARFIFDHDLPKVVAKLQEVKTIWDAKCEEFFAGYEQHQRELIQAYPQHRATLEEAYPDVEELRLKFSFIWNEFEVATPKSFRKEFKAEDVNANIANAVNEAQRIVAEEMRQKALSQGKQLFDFVRDLGVTFRQRILEACTSVIEKRKMKTAVTAGSLKKLLKTVEEFKEINILDDTLVAERLKELEAFLNTEGVDEKIDNTASLEKLDAVLAGVVAETQKISDVDQLTGKYFRAVEVDD